MAQNRLVQYEIYRGVSLTEKGAGAAIKIKRDGLTPGTEVTLLRKTPLGGPI